MTAPPGRGRPPFPDILTPAEWQVLNLVRHGAGNRRIARLRGTSLDAVKFHVANLMAKLGVADRAALRQAAALPAATALARRGAVAARQGHAGGPEEETEDGMAGEFALGRIGQVSRQVGDIARAEEWYRSVLGLRHLYTYGKLAFFDCGGTRLFLSAEAEGPAGPPSILYFQVDDILAAHRILSDRGAVFRGAPHMIHRHGDGTEEWMAFFDDPDGQPLAIMAQVRPAEGAAPGRSARS